MLNILREQAGHMYPVASYGPPCSRKSLA
jgi:hypothetical protein